jgi:hypothetical protein
VCWPAAGGALAVLVRQKEKKPVRTTPLKVVFHI